MTRKPPASDQTPDFEQALTELEALVQRLEEGDLPLDEALLTFERGVSLTRECQSALQAAQQKVEILLRRSGEVEAVPFDIALPENGSEPEDDLVADDE